MKPKFIQGQRVKIADHLGKSMSHFDSGCEAIIDYCYNDKYGCGDIDSWSLALIDEDTGEIYNRVSWYYTEQLTLINSDPEDGLNLMKKYHAKKGRRSFIEFSK